MTRRVVLHFMIIILLTLALSETVLTIAVRHYFYDGVKDTLLQHAEDANTLYKKFNSQLVLSHWSNSLNEAMDSFDMKKTLLEIYDAGGDMVASSTGLISQSTISPEGEVFEGEPTSKVERLPQTGEKVMAVYYPIHIRGKLFILRYLSSLTLVDKELLLIDFVSIGCGLVIALLVFFVSLKLAQSIVMPMKHIIKVSAKMASGNFSMRMKDDYNNELGTLAKTLNGMAEEIQKNEKLQNTFISSISHELLTPLTGIKGWSETMLMNEDTTQNEFREGLKVISHESDRLKLLVGDLLDLSKLKQNTLTLDRQMTRLDETVRQSVASMHVKAAEKHCRIVLHHCKRLIAYVDRNRMQQVITNLLDNAIKFADRDSQIIVSLEEDETTIRLSVRDWGVVINMEDIPKLTNPFFQIHANGRGSGLGLAISKNIIDLHDGELRITSDPGTGTEALIILSKP